jgi:hypothetical protein
MPTREILDRADPRKARGQRRRLFAQQLLFRTGELLKFGFANLRIFQIEIGEGVDHRRRNDG